MDDLEQKLKSVRLAAPPADLDRRMETLFSTARRSPKDRRPDMFYWWLAAATAFACTAALFVLASHRSPSATEAVVYRVEAQGLMREMLLNPTNKPDELAPFVLPGGSP